MPVRLLTQAERDRFTGFPSEVSRHDLRASFGLTPRDRAWVRRRRSDTNRLGLAVQLGCVRLLGFVPDFATIPGDVVEFVATQLDAPPSLAGYGERDQTRSDHLNDVLEHLGYRQPGELELKRLREWLVDRALEHHRPLVLFEQACGWLTAERLVRPGVTVLERMIAAAMTAAAGETASRLDPMLSTVTRQRLDSLLTTESDLGISRLVWLRRGVSSITPAGVLEGITKIQYLRRLGVDRWDLTALNPNRVKYLARQGRTATPQHLARAGGERRYPTLAAFCAQALADLTDETLDGY